MTGVIGVKGAQRKALDAADDLSATNAVASRDYVGSLTNADFNVDYSVIPDGAPGYDPQSGYKIYLTGAGSMTVSSGFLGNSVANNAGYAVSTLRRRPQKLEATFRLTAGGGTDAQDATVALVVCKGAMDFATYQDLSHFIWTKTTMSFQKFVGGVFTNIATHSYSASLSLNTDYTVSVEIDWDSGVVTMTDPFGVTHTNSDADLKTNWGRTVLHEASEQSNGPKVKFSAATYQEMRLEGDTTQVARQADFWLPQNIDDGTPAIAENIPMARFYPGMANLSVLTSGVMYLVGGMVLPAGAPVNRLRFLSGDTAAGTPTNQWAALLDRSGRVLAVTADRTNSAWGTDSFKTFSFATPYVPTGPTPVYVGLMVKAATPPSLVGLSTGGKYNWIFYYDDGIAGNAAATGLSTPIAVDSTRRPLNSPSGLTTNIAYVVAE